MKRNFSDILYDMFDFSRNNINKTILNQSDKDILNKLLDEYKKIIVKYSKEELKDFLSKKEIGKVKDYPTTLFKLIGEKYPDFEDLYTKNRHEIETKKYNGAIHYIRSIKTLLNINDLSNYECRESIKYIYHFEINGYNLKDIEIDSNIDGYLFLKALFEVVKDN